MARVGYETYDNMDLADEKVSGEVKKWDIFFRIQEGGGMSNSQNFLYLTSNFWNAKIWKF